MSRSFSIRPSKMGTAGNLYVIQSVDHEQSELERFVLREKASMCSADQRKRCLVNGGQCKRACKRPEHLNRLYETLSLAVNETGFRPELFRSFDTYKYPVSALFAGNYRLYGLRFDRDLFVAGNGGIKHTRRIQDDPDLHTAFQEISLVARSLMKRMKQLGYNHPPYAPNGLLHLPDSLIQRPF